MNLIFPASGDV